MPARTRITIHDDALHFHAHRLDDSTVILDVCPQTPCSERHFLLVEETLNSRQVITKEQLT